MSAAVKILISTLLNGNMVDIGAPTGGGPEAIAHTYWPMHNPAQVVFDIIVHDLYLAFKT